jgi:hypothetical protein
MRKVIFILSLHPPEMSTNTFVYTVVGIAERAEDVVDLGVNLGRAGTQVGQRGFS